MVRSRFRRLTAYTLVAMACLPSTQLSAQAGAAAEQQLGRRLGQKVTVTWQGQQLGAALVRLAEAQGIAVWLDRRVDPSAPIEFTADERPLGEVFAGVAKPRQCAVTAFHGVLYVGPEQTAGELLTLSAAARESLAKAPAKARSRWLKPEPWSFPRLSEPRPFVASLAKSMGVTLHGDERIPHDLWPARELPPMAALDRLVLVLAGFDLTCEISADGRRLHVTPIKRPLNIRGAAPQRPAIAKRAAPGNTPAGERRFTLKIENQPLGRVLDQLAYPLKLQIEWDDSLQQNPAAGREAVVSCDVRQVDLDGLLEALLAPAGLAFERDGKRVKIRREE